MSDHQNIDLPEETTAERCPMLGCPPSLTVALFIVFPFTITGSGHCYAQCEYNLMVIQAQKCPIFGIPPIEVSGLSNTGHVVGWHRDCEFLDDVAYVWTPEHGLLDIPIPDNTLEPRAQDINDQGRIVGSACFVDDDLSILAFVYENGTLTKLETLPGGNFSEAVAVNGLGEAVGTAMNQSTGDPPPTACLWQDGLISGLDLPFGPNSIATDINDNGQIVGWMGQSTGQLSRAYVWERGFVTDLGNAPGAFASDASAINNTGQVIVIGRFQTDNSPVVVHSFLWDDSDWTDLGLLTGFDRCFALDVNDARQVVGYCSKSAQPSAVEAFIWQHGVMMALEDLVAPGQREVGLSRAITINQLGQIAATGGFEADPAVLLLTPIRAPGDLDHDCAVGQHDMHILFEAWGPCPSAEDCPGDLDGDGFVGIVDFFILFANWG